MTVPVTRADREATVSYLRGQVRRAFQGDPGKHHEVLLDAFARHRIATLEAVERALKAAQYSPSPYTDCMAEIRKMKEPDQ